MSGLVGGWRAVACAALVGAAVSHAAAQEIVLPTIRDVTLPNGARLLLAERHDVPLISYTAYLRGGAVSDPPGKEGLASLTAEMLRKGAGTWSARALAEAVDGVGGTFGTGGAQEACYAAGEFLSRDQELMIETLRAVLCEPTFPDSEFTKLRAQTIEALTARKQDPGNVYRLYGAAFFFGDHPYGRPVDGDEGSVAAITRDDVVRCYREQIGADRLTLSVVGDFSAKTMERRLRAAFGGWRRAEGAIPAIGEPERRTGRRVLLVDAPEATQAYFALLNAGASRTDPDRDVLDVANTAFGGRYTSMLNTALRIKSGLTYGASCRLSSYWRGGSISIGSFTQTESAKRAIDLALETLQGFREAGLDSATLASSRNYLNGQFPTDLETAGQLAGRLASDAFFGLGRDEITGYPARIAAVDGEAVRRVVRRVYPQVDDLDIAIVGNADALRAMAAEYGPVTEIKLSTPMLEALRGSP